jgi:hypothetical protein
LNQARRPFIARWVRQALIPVVVLASFSTLAADASFEVEPTHRATVRTTMPLPEGTTLKFSAQDFNENEMLVLQRCGDPCNSAKMIRTWRKADFKATAQKSVVLAEAGAYYFWILQSLANGEVGPVLGDAANFEGMKGSVRFASGTQVFLEIKLAASK